jgi:hypothetical protein
VERSILFGLTGRTECGQRGEEMRRTRKQILEARHQTRAAYGELFDATAALLFYHDPINISSGNPNTDEYEPEVQTILPRLSNCHSSEEAQRVVHEEFVRRFGADTAGPQERYEQIASELWRLWQRSGKTR